MLSRPQVLRKPERVTPDPMGQGKVGLVWRGDWVDVHALALPVVLAPDGEHYALPPGWDGDLTPVVPTQGVWVRVPLAVPGGLTAPLAGHVLLLVCDGAGDDAPTFDGAVAVAPAQWAGVPLVMAHQPQALTPGLPDWPTLVAYLASHSAAALAHSFVPLAGTAVQSDAPALVLALTSCQYPGQLFDRPLAQASFRRLAARLAAPTGRPTLLFRVGDQIYADATAGLLDAKRLADRYDNRYQDAWCELPAALTAGLAIHTQLDDHELADNWEPHASPVWVDDLRAGRRAFVNQRTVDEAEVATLWYPLPTDGPWGTGGVPIFLADSRTERGFRHATNGHQATIMSAVQMAALQAWMLRSASEDPDRPMLIAMPAMLLPRHLAVTQDPGMAWRCDGWDGYPASLHELLGFIAQHRIRNTVFLSGDEHLASACQIRLWAAGQPRSSAVSVLSLHTPGLYAPFPFSNGRVQDFKPQDRFSFGYQAPDGGRHRFRCALTTAFSDNGDGFLVVTVAKGDTGWSLCVEIDGAQGVQTRRFVCSAADGGFVSAPSLSDPTGRL